MTETKVACQVCRKAVAVAVVKDHGFKTYPACRTCEKAMAQNARYMGASFEVVRRLS